MRALEGARVQGYYVVAIDGVHICRFDYEHCPNCIKRKDSKGRMQWQHYKVQASIITPNGLYLPMASEWIESEEFYDKQDCESKAAKRLLKKLRVMYPLFEAIEESNMEWIVVFKKGVMPEVYRWIRKVIKRWGHQKQINTINNKEIKARDHRDHQQRVEREILLGGTRQQTIKRSYAWANAISHWQNKRKYNLLSCKETVDDNVTCKYTWLVSAGIKLNEKTVIIYP